MAIRKCKGQGCRRFTSAIKLFSASSKFHQVVKPFVRSLMEPRGQYWKLAEFHHALDWLRPTLFNTRCNSFQLYILFHDILFLSSPFHYFISSFGTEICRPHYYSIVQQFEKFLCSYVSFIWVFLVHQSITIWKFLRNKYYNRYFWNHL